MIIKIFPALLLSGVLVWSCQTDQVLVERVLRDTVWVEVPPVQTIETKRDTVWQMKTVRDTVIVIQDVITTETVFIEKQLQLIDTVYKEVMKTETVIEVDTVFVDRVEIVERRLTIVHPGLDNYQAVEDFAVAINEWLNRVRNAGLQPKAETIIFTPIRWGNPSFGVSIFEENGLYYAYLEGEVDATAIWRVMSNILLDIPLIEVGSDIEYYYDWWEGEVVEVQLKPHYDHMMFVFFPAFYYDAANPERQEWYWEDMLNSIPN